MCVASLVGLTPLQTAIADVVNEAKKTNFVTIVIDDMGFSDLGYFGGEVPTPNLDQLTEGGIALTNFYAAPTSTPSRAILFTGKDHHQAGIGSMVGIMGGRGDKELMQQPGYEGVLSKDVPTFAEVLQQNGYQTMMTGKWDMGDKPGQYAHDRGFEVTKGLLLPGGDMQYLSDENGNLLTAQLPSYYENLGRTSPYNENGQEVTEFPPNAYTTDYYTDSAIAMLDARDSNRPFYLNVAHIATHTPWQAPPEVTAKYMDTYAKGWDVLRKERFERLKANDILPTDAQLPPRPTNLRAWSSLSSTEQKVEANKMAVYAAMIEMLDNSVGRLVQHFKDIGEYNNTVFIVYSDNGGESVSAGLTFFRDHIINNFNTTIEPSFDPNNYQNMGDATWYIGPNEEWAMLSNMPFNKHKVTLFDGGFHVPAFIHYPQAKVSGVKYDCMHSVMDFAPTILDMAEAPYPDTWNGKPLSPMQGVSMAGLLKGNFSCDANRWLAWEFDGMKAVRHAGWALSQTRFDDTLYLFDLEEDPYERNELSAQRQEKKAELFGYYQQYVTENNVFEVSAKYLPNLEDVSLAAGISGGVAANGVHSWKNNATFLPTDQLDVAAFIRVAHEHVGQKGEIFAYGNYTPTDGSQPVFFTLTETGLHFQSANESMPNFKPMPLSTSIPISIFQGVVATPGKAEIMVGYKVNGMEVFNNEMITFTISE